MGGLISALYLFVGCIYLFNKLKERNNAMKRRYFMLMIITLCAVMSYGGVFGSVREVQGYMTSTISINGDTLYVLHHEDTDSNMGILYVLDELYGNNAEKLAVSTMITFGIHAIQKYASVQIVYPLYKRYKIKVLTISLVVITMDGSIYYGGDYSLNLKKFMKVGRVIIMNNHYRDINNVNTMTHEVKFYNQYVDMNVLVQGGIGNVRLMSRFGRW